MQLSTKTSTRANSETILPARSFAARGMTQAALADAMDVSRNTINSIEVGRYVPLLPLALCLARFFGKPVEEVFDERNK